MATANTTIVIRTTRRRLWPLARALAPLWRRLPHAFAVACMVRMLGTQYSGDGGVTWRDVR